MSFDLLNSNDRFSSLSIYTENKFPLTDDEFQTHFGVNPKRDAFFNIPWHNDMVYFMRGEELSQAPQLKEDFPGLILLSFADIPEKYKAFVYPLKEGDIQVVKTLEFIEEVMNEREKIRLLKEAQERSSLLFKEAGQYISELEKKGEERVNPVIEVFLSLENELLQEEKLPQFIEKSAAHFEKLALWDDLTLASLDEIVGRRQEEPHLEVFPLDWMGLPHFLIFKLKSEKKREGYFALSLFLEWLEKYAAFHHDQSREGNDHHNLWHETLSALPLPVALINPLGDLQVYNQRFTKLNIIPRDCLAYQNDEAIEVGRELFKVKKIEVERGEGLCFLYLFFNSERLKSENTTQKDMKSISSQELGIISSSIAHELNNPLAGILAAIGLLELEDWDSDESDALKDMKTSAKRCKTLVEIFLGFSRANDQQQKQGTIREALGQALDLLRFRMIESNIRIEVEVEGGGEPFKRYVNLSLASMILYLVLGEVLTLFNHYRLVLGEDELKTLKTYFKEEADKISLSFPKDFELGNKIAESKLIKYLVDVLGLQLELDQNKLILQDWKLL